MSVRRRYAIYAAGTLGMVVAFYALFRGTGLSSRVEVALMLGSGMVSAAAYGWYQHAKATGEYDERGMHIRYRSGYVAFWAIYWFLFLFTLGGIRSVENGPTYYEIPVEPYVFVASTFGFGTVVMVASRTWYKRKF